MLTFISDDGHGWLRVSKEDLAAVGLTAADFSRYSYRNRTAIGSCREYYLEEDCDAGKFIRAFVAKHGNEPQIKEVYQRGQSPIRDLPSIRA
jgi:hypothetical protein